MAQVNLDNALESGREAFALSEPREVILKGIAQPVQVVSVSWR